MTKNVLKLLSFLFITQLTISLSAKDIDVKISKLLGQTNKSIILNADSVTAIRIQRSYKKSENNKEIKVDKELAKASLSNEQIKELKELLLSDNSFMWDVAKACKPRPGVRLEFTKGDQKLFVYLCFECSIVEFGENPSVTEDFDPIYKKLANLAKQLFPKDETIQKL